MLTHSLLQSQHLMQQSVKLIRIRPFSISAFQRSPRITLAAIQQPFQQQQHPQQQPQQRPLQSTSQHTLNQTIIPSLITRSLDSPQSRPLSAAPNAKSKLRCQGCGPVLTSVDLTEAISSIPSWSLLHDRPVLRKTFKFSDFASAFAFMTRIALYSEKVNHHPKFINNWNTVEIELTTHSVGGITQSDVKLAQQCDLFANHK